MNFKIYFTLLFISSFIYWIIPKQWLRNLVLIFASSCYLYLIDKRSIMVITGLTLFSYLFGNLISRYPKRNYIHIIGVVGILALFILFKYLGWMVGIINSLSEFIAGLPGFEIRQLLLPLGISYIVFKHISYLTDIKWKLVKPGRLIDFLLYSSLFTIFVAGPIERFERFQPQVATNSIPFSLSNIEYGFRRIIFGLFKKLIIADWIGYFINPVWNNPHHYSQSTNMLVLLGYSLQIYFDFAGYSDIAIGSSRLFGIKIMENFNSPYLAPNISQFWRRWHISLSDWIRDYLFFPLSRLSNKKIWLMGFVPIIAMSLCGLWHGAAWHFILWGTWHGIGIATLQSWISFKRKHQYLISKQPTLSYFDFNVMTNFIFVTIGWIAFHSGGWKLMNSLVSIKSLLLLFFGSCLIVSLFTFYEKRIARIVNSVYGAVVVLVLIFLLYGMMDTEIIYAQF